MEFVGGSVFFEKSILPKLECHLFAAKAKPDSPFLKINNATFSHWKKIWEAILQQEHGEPLSSDNFLRQDIICSITRHTEVVGMIAASFFCPDQMACESHSYLKPFMSSSGFDRALAWKENAMSIEYLSVDPRFRKSEWGISFGSVLLGLSMEIFRQSRSEIVLGMARSKIHVDEMCYKFGFSPCGEMEKYGHPCTLIVNSRQNLIRHDDPLVNRTVNALWENRRDYFRETTAPLKLVA